MSYGLPYLIQGQRRQRCVCLSCPVFHAVVPHAWCGTWCGHIRHALVGCPVQLRNHPLCRDRDETLATVTGREIDPNLDRNVNNKQINYHIPQLGLLLNSGYCCILSAVAQTYKNNIYIDLESRSNHFVEIH